MRIDILSVIPELLSSPFQFSIVKRAMDSGVVDICIHDLKDYSLSKRRSVDDYPYGGQAGMVMQCEPIARCIDELLLHRTYDAIIYATPDGIPWKQHHANSASLWKNIILLCGHYKGVDERIREEYITHEYSLGDFVLSGGELAAAAFVDSIVRLIPGSIGDQMSALSDSFQDRLLSPPVYTRPETWRGRTVPSVLLSGNTKKIEDWQDEQSLGRTQERRPDLLDE